MTNKKISVRSYWSYWYFHYSVTIFSNLSSETLSSFNTKFNTNAAIVPKEIPDENTILIDSGNLAIKSGLNVTPNPNPIDIAIINKGNITLSGNLKEIKKDFGKNRLILSANNYTLESLKKICETKFNNLISVYEVKKDFLVLELCQNCTKNTLLTNLINSNIDIEKFAIYEPTLTDIFVLKAGDE